MVLLSTFHNNRSMAPLSRRLHALMLDGTKCFLPITLTDARKATVIYVLFVIFHFSGTFLQQQPWRSQQLPALLLLKSFCQLPTYQCVKLVWIKLVPQLTSYYVAILFSWMCGLPSAGYHSCKHQYPSWCPDPRTPTNCKWSCALQTLSNENM